LIANLKRRVGAASGLQLVKPDAADADHAAFGADAIAQERLRRERLEIILE